MRLLRAFSCSHRVYYYSLSLSWCLFVYMVFIAGDPPLAFTINNTRRCKTNTSQFCQLRIQIVHFVRRGLSDGSSRGDGRGNGRQRSGLALVLILLGNLGIQLIQEILVVFLFVTLRQHAHNLVHILLALVDDINEILHLLQGIAIT